MSKNAIVTLAIGDAIKDISRISLPILKRYAKQIDAELVVITEPSEYSKSSGLLYWERFYIKELFDQYDRIACLDLDMIVRDNCPSVFDVVPQDCVGMYDEGHFKIDQDRQGLVMKVSKHFGIDLQNYSGIYGNFGIIVTSREHKEIFTMPNNPPKDRSLDIFLEQTWINIMIEKHQFKRFNLDARFNRMRMLDIIGGISRDESYIIHYAGDKREDVPTNMLFDIKAWGKKWKELI